MAHKWSEIRKKISPDRRNGQERGRESSRGFPGRRGMQGCSDPKLYQKVRKARFALDQEALLPCFEVNAVRDGVFLIANRLYGFTFHEREDLPSSVRTTP